MYFFNIAEIVCVCVNYKYNKMISGIPSSPSSIGLEPWDNDGLAVRVFFPSVDSTDEISGTIVDYRLAGGGE